MKRCFDCNNVLLYQNRIKLNPLHCEITVFCEMYMQTENVKHNIHFANLKERSYYLEYVYTLKSYLAQNCSDTHSKHNIT